MMGQSARYRETGVEVPAELAERPLELSVRKLADDLAFGEDASAYFGPGIDYAQSRPFAHGDEIRDVDWRVTARRGKLYTKEYEALRRLSMYVAVDTSASMALSSQPLTKHRLAAVIAGALGLCGVRRQSPVGLIAAGTRSLRIAPGLSRGRVLGWLHALAEADLREGTALGPSLDELGALLRARAVVLAVSDFHDPSAVEALARHAQRHECLALVLEDPAEEGRLRAGFFRAREAETGRAFVAGPRTRWFGREGRDLERRLQRAGIDHLRLRTDRPFVGPLRMFLRQRGVLGRNTR